MDQWVFRFLGGAPRGHPRLSTARCASTQRPSPPRLARPEPKRSWAAPAAPTPPRPVADAMYHDDTIASRPARAVQEDERSSPRGRAVCRAAWRPTPRATSRDAVALDVSGRLPPFFREASRRTTRPSRLVPPGAACGRRCGAIRVRRGPCRPRRAACRRRRAACRLRPVDGPVDGEIPSPTEIPKSPRPTPATTSTCPPQSVGGHPGNGAQRLGHRRVERKYAKLQKKKLIFWRIAGRRPAQPRVPAEPGFGGGSEHRPRKSPDGAAPALSPWVRLPCLPAVQGPLAFGAP